jgi:hypothetical protein
MKYTAILIFLLFLGFLAPAQVGVHTDFPDNSSAMDIVATDRGLLIPRITLTSDLSNPSPVTAPAVGLLVFNAGANQPIGFYYWNGSAWVLVGGGSPGGSYWSLLGNAGTTPGTNFLGTTDNNNFLVYTNNAERMRFESDGQVLIGGTTPYNSTDLLTVIGNSTQKSAFNAYSPGTGFYSNGGRYGLYAIVDTAVGTAPGSGVYARNYDAGGFGVIAIGSNATSFPFITSHTAGVTTYGYDGMHAWGRDANGYGIFAVGSAAVAPFNIAGVSAGLSAVANYGIITRGTSATGRGIVAVGSGQSSPSISNESEGGAFTGYHGIYSKGVNAQGIGVIGVGSNSATYSTISGGLGGSFTGNYGVYGKGLATEGVGVLGLGSNGAGYYTVTGGSGGAFTGFHGALAVGSDVTSGIGVFGAGNNGVYTLLPSFGAGGSFTGTNIGSASFGNSPSAGIGTIGAGNNQAAWIPSNGCGGAYIGNTGVFSRSSNATGTGVVGLGNNLLTPGTFSSGCGGAFTGLDAGLVGWGTNAVTGTGVVGTGNNISAPMTYGSGSGGAFTGTAAGVVGYGTTVASGIGVIGAGNNLAPTIPAANGCGGAFTGVVCGVYGNSTQTSGLRYGGYFATTNGQYAYVGGRSNNTNQKIIGTGTVNTIVKSTQGELLTLTCPEAPVAVFQDFGTGQLANGFAHITIDPDLAININVSEEHPLRVYITPEGDCNGVFVTNKSANGFDVVELRGGQSNVNFSWQIVATRANEEYILRDGSIEVSDYSQRFPPAPGPLEVVEPPATRNQMVPLETTLLNKVTSTIENYKATQAITGENLKIIEDTVTKDIDDHND